MSTHASQPHAGVAGFTTQVTGRRIGAAILDLLVLVVLMIVLAVAFGESRASNGQASVGLHGLSVLLFWLLALAYYVIPEAMTGQTLGKRALGLRVVTLDGGTPSTGAIVGRNLMRIVDALPLFYLLGLVVVLAGGDRGQRLGDMAAGTRVVGD